MKKTLIALAVLAVSGASFAQVTITGKVGFGFGKSASQTASNANTSSGMHMFDGDVNFTANEDLGGGFRAIASTEVQLRGRNDDATAATTNGGQFRPRNATISLVTPFGLITGGALESPSGFFRATSYKVFLNTGFDNASGPWDGKANIDFVRYLVPIAAVPGLQVSAWYTEVAAGAGNLTVAALGAGVTAPGVMVNYAKGPITAYFDYFNFQTNKAAFLPQFDSMNRYRIGGDYDFGIAKVFVGYQTKDKKYADQYAFGLTVPLGAVTANLTYGSRDKQEAAPGLAAAEARTGTTLQVQYNFSKLTLAEVSYETYTGGNKIANGQLDLSDGYRVTLRKYF